MSSDYGSSYCRSLKSLDAEILRLTKLTRDARANKMRLEKNLFEWLSRTGRSEITYEGKTYKKDKLKPKMPGAYSRKKKSEKERDGMRLLRELGVNDPETTYYEFVKTQKILNGE